MIQDDIDRMEQKSQDELEFEALQSAINKELCR